MIIIDQNTDAILSATLEKIKFQGLSTRCIHFNLKSGTAGADFISRLFDSAKEHIASPDTQVYLCGDGDIFILAPAISSRLGWKFISDIAALLGRGAEGEWVRFIELPRHINVLLVEVEAKIEKKRKQEEEKQRHLEQAQAENKRKAILSGGATRHHDIGYKRAERKTPKLMIIEDDVFSRRLVENVLEKKYPLTGLGEATHALDTYALLAPDLLFLDIDLPDVTGHELLEKIMALDPDAYVVMLSGNCDRENIMQAMSRGAKGFVAKPFTKDKIFQYIERCPTLRH